MDGNGCWVQQCCCFCVIGYCVGVCVVNCIIECCFELGILVLILFVFFSENWGWLQEEVDVLMKLFFGVFDCEVDELYWCGVCVCFIGECECFGVGLVSCMQLVEQCIVDNIILILLIVVSYGGCQDIVCVVCVLVVEVVVGCFLFEQIDELLLGSWVVLVDLLLLDLFICIGGDICISNFLLWQFVYIELWFIEVLWLDFDVGQLQQVFDVYVGCECCFGLISVQIVVLVIEIFSL